MSDVQKIEVAHVFEHGFQFITIVDGHPRLWMVMPDGNIGMKIDRLDDDPRRQVREIQVDPE